MTDTISVEHTPNCGTCIRAVLKSDLVLPDSKVAIASAAHEARNVMDPLTVVEWGKPIVMAFGIYPPAEVAQVIRDLEERLADVAGLVPLAAILTSTPWPEFEYPAIAFQSRTTDELIRHSGSI